MDCRVLAAVGHCLVEFHVFPHIILPLPPPWRSSSSHSRNSSSLSCRFAFTGRQGSGFWFNERARLQKVPGQLGFIINQGKSQGILIDPHLCCRIRTCPPPLNDQDSPLFKDFLAWRMVERLTSKRSAILISLGSFCPTP